MVQIAPARGRDAGTRRSAAQSLRRHIVAGFACVAVFGGGVGGWAATTELSGAVVAAGTVVVDTNRRVVQHPTGGIVSEIAVRDGQAVATGEILLRLDATLTRASLGIVEGQIDQLAARQARLEAERDGREAITFPEDLVMRAAEPAVGRLIASEERLFTLRRTARKGLEAQLTARVGQIADEIEGLTIQAQAKARELALIGEELDGVRDLYARELVPVTRVNALEREAARLEGERGQLLAAAAQARGEVSETELQIVQVEQDLRSETAQEIRDVQTRLAELAERQVAARDQLGRIEIRAPHAGVVHQLAIHTIGAVIRSGETLMQIVPGNDALSVEARIAPQDVDQVHVGQSAFLRLSAFSQRTTPEVAGTVARISADLVEDERSGQSYFTARIALTDGHAQTLRSLQLVPGMPVEVYMRTGERTLFSYLTKPIGDYLAQAFRQD